ncbi:bromodomain-containing protein 8 isoform X1 [Salmo salar]|uniref:Bromodomain-containing protein 8 n=2 Tax=Salmo salar TaxID=8030 RepID=A0A1S3SVU4_SALSA|nr:bromodomain-containing protein 8-like isoform X1 [Salmo salar]XP_045580066.1 bromodomain-containing protein 8-like isoform X1 [Salmo salar]|eukprot:XP_014068461.1 PREDICTED: bromodomain-containing protein 8-like isoform X1 [Salmo salar]
MASGVGKHKRLSVGPTEPWSLREKLCLASSVMRSGDQNWVSVSRAIKPFSEPGRPPDWFSQKHCASQYSELLETTEAPKRKRGEKGEVVETIEDVIVRRLTAERIEELKKLLRDTQDKYRKLKKEVDLIQTGHLDSRLEELWTDITQKNKQDEDEADLKRKATETSYQARQTVKNTPKRVSSVTIRSPLGASPTSMEGAQTDTPTPPIDTAMPQAEETPGANLSQGGAVFLPSSDAGPKEGSLGSLVDDSPQKRLLSQKSTPPPSPLLSELLKKGSLISASPRLVVEGDAAGLANGGVPTTTPAITADFEVAIAVKEAGSEVMEEDHVPGSYMGDELDLETVGDIISIIEEKVDDSVEALDAAAVEAALSLCEEAVSAGHSLSGPWEAQDLKASEPGPMVQSDPTHGLQAAAGANPGSLEPQTESGRGEAEEGNGKDCEGQETVQTNVAPSVVADDGLSGSEVTEEGVLGEEGALSTAVKTENEEWTQPELNTPCLDSEDSSGSGKESKEVKVEDGGSDGDPDEGMEMKECGEGEGPYLSEVEPAASESEDGYGPSSQRYTTADSLASSPASSQFSICGEDQEAVQAQKIWKKAIMLVWRAAANHRYASVFLQSVSEDIAPGYHSIVHRPMDLSAIKKSIEAGQIRTTAEFQRDIMLMFQNAVMYNSSDHDVFHMALEMQRDVLEHVQQFLATQLIMQTSESSISTKSLRGREGGRKPGECVEKDSVPMASPAFLLSLFDGGTRGRRCAIEADMKMKK